METVNINISCKINALRTADINNFHTNCFLSDFDNACFINSNENAIIFFIREYDFYRLYYAYTDMNAFENLLRNIPDNISYSIEILQKEPLSDEVKNTIDKYAPFNTIFIRMRAALSNIKVQTFYKPNEIEYASPNEVELIHKSMFSTFSKYYSHIQTIETLQNYVDNRQIIVVRDDDSNLAAFLIFTINGLVSHNNQAININGNPAYGIKVIDSYYSRMRELGIKNIYLWVDTINNSKVQKMHEIYGYQADGLKNYIFVKEQDNL